MFGGMDTATIVSVPSVIESFSIACETALPGQNMAVTFVCVSVSATVLWIRRLELEPALQHS